MEIRLKFHRKNQSKQFIFKNEKGTQYENACFIKNEKFILNSFSDMKI